MVDAHSYASNGGKGSRVLQDIVRDPSYLDHFTTQPVQPKGWDSRHHLGRLPGYDALNDRYCKWTKNKRHAATLDKSSPALERFPMQPAAATFGGMAAQLPSTPGINRSWPPKASHDGGHLPPIQQGWNSPMVDPQPPAQPRGRDVAPLHQLSTRTTDEGAQKFITANDLKRPKANRALIPDRVGSCLSGQVNMQALPQLFAKSQQTICDLWDRLGIPEVDRQQFAAVAFVDVNTDNLRLMNDEIQRLLDRRNASVQVEKHIEIREGFLYLLQELAERASIGPLDRDKFTKELMPLVVSTRTASLDIVEAVSKWRDTVENPEAVYFWKGVSYLMKMQEDLAFLAYSKLASLLDFKLNNNPLLYPNANRDRVDGNIGLQHSDKLSSLHNAQGGLILPHASRRIKYDQLLATKQAVDGYQKGQLPPVKQKRGESSIVDPLHMRVVAAERILSDEASLLALAHKRGSTNSKQLSSSHAMTKFQPTNDEDGDVPEEIERADFDDEPGPVETVQEDEWLSNNLCKQNALDHRAATKIQSVWRGYEDRCVASAKLEQKDCAIKIQTVARKYLAKKEMRKRHRRFIAARKIQAVARGMLARLFVAQINLENGAATYIQAAWRGYNGRRVAGHQLARRRGATDIQRVWKGYYIRSRLQAVEYARKTRAATDIQRVWRGVMVRMRPEFVCSKVEAAIQIQAWWKGIMTRQYCQWVRRRRIAATRIQALQRGIVARKYVESIQDRKQEEDYRAFLKQADMRACDIQRVWRGYNVRKHTNATITRQHEEEACVSIQKLYRGFATRRELDQVQFAQAREYAATKIQAEVRRWEAQIIFRKMKSAVTATKKIQSWIRGIQCRRETSCTAVQTSVIKHEWNVPQEVAIQEDDTDLIYPNPNMDNASEVEHLAAMKLQRFFRFAVSRKKVSALRSTRGALLAHASKESAKEEREEAATRIQAIYRMYSARQKVALLQEESILKKERDAVKSLEERIRLLEQALMHDASPSPIKRVVEVSTMEISEEEISFPDAKHPISTKTVSVANVVPSKLEVSSAPIVSTKSVPVVDVAALKSEISHVQVVSDKSVPVVDFATSTSQVTSVQASPSSVLGSSTVGAMVDECSALSLLLGVVEDLSPDQFHGLQLMDRAIQGDKIPYLSSLMVATAGSVHPLKALTTMAQVAGIYGERLPTLVPELDFFSLLMQAVEYSPDESWHGLQAVHDAVLVDVGTQGDASKRPIAQGVATKHLLPSQSQSAPLRTDECMTAGSLIGALVQCAAGPVPGLMVLLDAHSAAVSSPVSKSLAPLQRPKELLPSKQQNLQVLRDECTTVGSLLGALVQAATTPVPGLLLLLDVPSAAVSPSVDKIEARVQSPRDSTTVASLISALVECAVAPVPGLMLLLNLQSAAGPSLDVLPPAPVPGPTVLMPANGHLLDQLLQSAAASNPDESLLGLSLLRLANNAISDVFPNLSLLLLSSVNEQDVYVYTHTHLKQAAMYTDASPTPQVSQESPEAPSLDATYQQITGVKQAPAFTHQQVRPATTKQYGLELLLEAMPQPTYLQGLFMAAAPLGSNLQLLRDATEQPFFYLHELLQAVDFQSEPSLDAKQDTTMIDSDWLQAVCSSWDPASPLGAGLRMLKDARQRDDLKPAIPLLCGESLQQPPQNAFPNLSKILRMTTAETFTGLTILSELLKHPVTGCQMLLSARKALGDNLHGLHLLEAASVDPSVPASSASVLADKPPKSVPPPPQQISDTEFPVLSTFFMIASDGLGGLGEGLRALHTALDSSAATQVGLSKVQTVVPKPYASLSKVTILHSTAQRPLNHLLQLQKAMSSVHKPKRVVNKRDTPSVAPAFVQVPVEPASKMSLDSQGVASGLELVFQSATMTEQPFPRLDLLRQTAVEPKTQDPVLGLELEDPTILPALDIVFATAASAPGQFEALKLLAGMAGLAGTASPFKAQEPAGSFALEVLISSETAVKFPALEKLVRITTGKPALPTPLDILQESERNALQAKIELKLRADQQRELERHQRLLEDQQIRQAKRQDHDNQAEQRRHAAATSIQSGVRGYQGRKYASAKKEEKAQIDAVTNAQKEHDKQVNAVASIERAWVYQGRNNIAAVKYEAARKVQCAWRSHVARQEVATRRWYRARNRREIIEKEESQEDAAVKIQCAVRQDRAVKEKQKYEMERHIHSITPSVECIQRAQRSYVARQEYKKLLQAKNDAIAAEKMKDIRYEAALTIQLAHRCYKARIELAHRAFLADQARREANKDQSSLRIQRQWRQKMARDELKRRKAIKKREVDQRKSNEIAEEEMDRRQAEEQKLSEQETAYTTLRNTAAAVIQRGYRCYNARFLLSWKQKEREAMRRNQAILELDKTQHTSATKIQARARGMASRKMTNELRQETWKSQAVAKKEAKSLASASAVIQRSWRCHAARNELACRQARKAGQKAQSGKAQKEAYKQEMEAIKAKIALQRQEDHKQEAALKIQLAWRRYNARFELKWRKEKAEQEKSKDVKGNQTSIDRKNLQTTPGKRITKSDVKLQDDAATNIQRIHRGSQARKEVKLRQELRKKDTANDEAADYAQAATQIQRVYRGSVARAQVANKETPTRSQITEEMVVNESAIEIQRVYRGSVARKRVSDLKSQSASREDKHSDGHSCDEVPPTLVADTAEERRESVQE
mmetsp:Transcript_51983/g.92775  ORF Transcript_51983/g.92775 Transcript_51983/m.92775 type:complete len:2664 (-) Transcript_51983:286-8277(-)